MNQKSSFTKVVKLTSLIKSQQFGVICSQMFILSQSKLSTESKKFLYQPFKGHQPKEVNKIKSQNYAVIGSQMFILSQYKLSMESKKFFKQNV